MKRSRLSLTFLCFYCILHVILLKRTEAKKWADIEETSEYWNNVGQFTLSHVLQRKLNEKPAKNVILFMGDGMSLGTMTAGRIFSGQQQGLAGEGYISSLDMFDNVGLSKVYSVDKQAPDSASAATALLCGVKTKFQMLGVNGKAKHNDCPSVKGNQVDSILEISAQEGKSTGIVTTTKVQDASPAAAYAHVPTRGWMSDDRMPSIAKQEGCKDISKQLIDMGTKLNVILGGGRFHMRPKGAADEEHPQSWARGKRSDNRDLIADWLETMPKQTSKYVWNKQQFDQISPNSTDYLLGLFEPSGMKYEHLRNQDVAGEPSLSEMTAKAIEILQKNEKGYFLFVEGGRIDNAHHHNQANIALNEFAALEKAITTATQMTSMEDTLIVVTADHGHGFTLGGYADRGNPVNGFVRSDENPENARDGKRHTTITYANGPGHQGSAPIRENPTSAQIKNINYKFQTAIPLDFDTHSAEDTVILARGPMSHLFSGTFEQNYIPYAMKYASCVGQDQSLCESKETTKEGSKPGTPNVATCNSTNSEKDKVKEMEKEAQIIMLYNNVNQKITEIMEKVQLLQSLQIN